MHASNLQTIGAVTFPAWTGERVYMREFTRKDGLPTDLQRWQPTVDAMLSGLEAPGPVYIMIDQGEVRPGTSHRRPGVHIDGYWIAAEGAHRGGGHVGVAGRWEGRWNQCDFSTPEALVLASDVEAACAYVGEWNGAPGEGGDCAHIDLSRLRRVAMRAGVAYAGNVSMLHESLPLQRAVRRTLVRLSVPGCRAAL